jgi:hypothetical protein
MFITLLSHHYNNCKSVKNYVKQIKMLLLHLKEMNFIFQIELYSQSFKQFRLLI